MLRQAPNFGTIPEVIEMLSCLGLATGRWKLMVSCCQYFHRLHHLVYLLVLVMGCGGWRLPPMPWHQATKASKPVVESPKYMSNQLAATQSEVYTKNRTAHLSKAVLPANCLKQRAEESPPILNIQPTQPVNNTCGEKTDILTLIEPQTSWSTSKQGQHPPSRNSCFQV